MKNRERDACIAPGSQSASLNHWDAWAECGVIDLDDPPCSSSQTKLDSELQSPPNKALVPGKMR